MEPLEQYKTSNRAIDRLRVKFSGRARKADSGNSATSAIYLHCMECSGPDIHPRDCGITRCALWQYRPGGKDERPATVPTDAEYEAAAAAKYTDEEREVMRNRLAGARASQASEDANED